jgi:N-acetylglucosamine-6-phosphate deacetylase
VYADVIRQLKEHGITVAAGHSNATFMQAAAGFKMGVETVTHLFNAMTPLHHRDPGLPGAAFLSATACASIIADGIHVDYSMVAIAKEIMKKGSSLFLMPLRVNEEGSLQTCQAGRPVYNSLTAHLSGAKLSMLDAVRNCVYHAGIDLYEVIRMATLYPSRLIRADDRGVIAPGARADLLVLDNELRLKGICFNGITELMK